MIRSPRLSRWLGYVFLGAVLLLGLALRVYRVDHQEIWGDEGDKLLVVNGNLARVFDPSLDVHPRLWHVLLFGWRQIFQLNPFGLRLLAVWVGWLALPALYVWARRLSRSPAVGGLAVFCLALSPFHISYSQDLTAYALLFLTVTLSYGALTRALEQNNFSAWAMYVGASLLAVHTHYYAVFALLAQGVTVGALGGLGRDRPALNRLWAWLAAQAAIGAGLLPWVIYHYPVLAGRAEHVAQAITFQRLVEIITRGGLAFTLGYTFPAGWAWVAGGIWLGMGLGLVGLWRAAATRRAAALLTAGILIPLWVVWLFAMYLPRFNERFLMMSLPPTLVLLGWAMSAAPRLWFRRGGLLVTGGLAAVYAALCLFSLRAWYFDPQYLKSRYGEMMALIAQMAQPGDELLVNGPEQTMLFEIYHPRELAYRFISPGSLLTEAAVERDLPELVAGYRRVWLVLYGDPAAYDPQHRAEAWLGQKAYKAFFQSYTGHSVTLYVFPAQAGELTAIDAQFADGPRLIGYAVEPAVVRPGATVYVQLQWLSAGPLPADYTVFTHLLTPAGEFVVGADSQPAGGARPTTTWQAGETILDNHAILLPGDLPPGEYGVEVGLYDLPTLTRLPLAQPGGADALPLARVQVR